VELDTAVRWGMRALFLQDDPGGALGIFDRLQARWPAAAGPPNLAHVHMQLYQAAAQIERAEEGDWERARALLKDVQQKTETPPGEHPIPAAPDGLLWWARLAQDPPADSKAAGQQLLARTLQAMALDYEGYLDHQQGRYAEAMVHYQSSAMLQRRLVMAGLAPTLTNLSYTMALMGQFQNARLLAQEAERWARHGGKEYVLALALNTQALVEAYDNHPGDALRYAERGLKTIKGLRAPRVRGLLLLTRVKAHRYLLRVDEEGGRVPQSLDAALKEANLAVNLLKGSPTDRVQALIERGCLHREIARVHYARQQEAKAVRAARGSQRDLERAAALAGATNLLDQQALALTDLAWLWYYTGQIRKARHTLRQAKDSVPSDYWLPDQGGLPRRTDSTRRGEACLPFWTTLGKGEMLRAYIALDQGSSVFDTTERKKGLQEAVHHISCSLAYNELFADEHFFMTRAEESLHNRILHDRIEISDLHLYAQKAADELRLDQPTRFQRFLGRLFGPAELWA
jgi:tetratricopeptide (TPR) repeat protein